MSTTSKSALELRIEETSKKANIVIVGDDERGVAQFLRSLRIELNTEEKPPVTLPSQPQMQTYFIGDEYYMVRLMAFCHVDANNDAAADDNTNDRNNRGISDELSNANLVLVCFSLFDRSSFDSVSSKWLPMLDNGQRFFLVGTQMPSSNNSGERTVTTIEAERLARSFGAQCFAYQEVSFENYAFSVEDLMWETLPICFAEAKVKRASRDRRETRRRVTGESSSACLLL